MELYKFFDTDETGTQIYDITDIRYRQLLKVCFQYCTSVAMCIHKSIRVDLSDMEPFRLQVTPQVKIQYGHYGRFGDDDRNMTGQYRIMHYQLTPEVKNFLLTRADAIFKWTYAWENENPDDLSFFRADGTVFFSSTVHEGECTLTPRQEEDVSLILNNSK